MRPVCVPSSADLAAATMSQFCTMPAGERKKRAAAICREVHGSNGTTRRPSPGQRVCRRGTTMLIWVQNVRAALQQLPQVSRRTSIAALAARTLSFSNVYFWRAQGSRQGNGVAVCCVKVCDSWRTFRKRASCIPIGILKWPNFFPENNRDDGSTLILKRLYERNEAGCLPGSRPCPRPVFIYAETKQLRGSRATCKSDA